MGDGSKHYVAKNMSKIHLFCSVSHTSPWFCLHNQKCYIKLTYKLKFRLVDLSLVRVVRHVGRIINTAA